MRWPEQRLRHRPREAARRIKNGGAMLEEATQSIFLSYNSADKDYVRRLAAAIAVTGAHVWFDEWTIRPGDSIPGAIDKGLSGFDTFVLLWSEAASRSRWVKTEMDAALGRWLCEDSLRLVPVRLDDTQVPVLLAPIRYIDGADKDHHRVALELLGIGSEAAYRLAVQGFIDEAGLGFVDHPGAGVLIACRRCGATIDHLSGWESVDYERDDTYAGVRCDVCGWSDGGEV